MPKYYVSSGEFRQVIDRPTPKDAAIDSFYALEENPVALSCVTVVSEQGFEDINEQDIWFLTLDILEQSDQIQKYNIEDF